MLVVVNWGDGGDIASTRFEEALAVASAAAVVAGRFFLVGNKRRGGAMGNTPRSTRKAAAVESKRFQQSNMTTDH